MATAARDFADLPATLAPVLAAVERAAAASEPMLLTGLPGSGKTMIAARTAAILPELTYRQTIRREAFALVLRHPMPPPEALRLPPFRAPHHTCGMLAMRSEFYQAEGGVLMLDQLDEFPRPSVETIAELLRVTDPGDRPLIIAAASPCPCGMYGWPTSDRSCSCGRSLIENHQRRLSYATTTLGIKLANVITVPLFRDAVAERCESSATIRARVIAARA